MQQFSVSSYLSLPEEPGVYQFLNKKGDVLYVGKAKNLKHRVSSYFQKSSTLFGKTALLVQLVQHIRIIPVESEIEALLLEANLIKKFSPKYNIRLTDGKAYPLIRITTRAQYPAVLMARRPEDKQSLYFGPFPNSGAVRSVLRLLRKVFPYHSTVNHSKRLCLYYHIGLCPCLPYFDTVEPVKHMKDSTLTNQYKKTIRHIVDFLEGNTKKVVKELEKERDSFSKKELFEDAARVQKQIDQILYVTQPMHAPFEYETNPNLKTDLRIQEMVSLQKILGEHGVKIELPRRIECYDNSNFQGTNPTSSMVVLTDGEIDTSQYRKFKIKSVKGPNDFASMQEVLTRRLRHTEWPLPDLFIVDGGKGQVSSAREVLEEHLMIDDRGLKMEKDSSQASPVPEQYGTRMSISLIGLAKREETIITPDLKEIRLPKSSPALKLVMRIRDEAHRFAITYHRKLRSKNAFM